MTGDNGEKIGESMRLLSPQERSLVAGYVAEQLLALTAVAAPAQRSRIRLAMDALAATPRQATALHQVRPVCAEILKWLAGGPACYPLLDDVLRATGRVLRALDADERNMATPLAMAACVLAAAAMARGRVEGVAMLPGFPGAAIAALTDAGEGLTA